MKPIEDIGLLKMDFLGLRNLDVIEDALDIIQRSNAGPDGEPAPRLDMTQLHLDDQRTYEMLARGDSTGVFQFESEGMREALKKVRPDEFNDLVALNALYRPGAMDQIPVYAKGKHQPEAITYADERLRPILESSKGVILYQEQAMQIAKELAGFSGAKADDLRKAIGKKNRAAMAALKGEFVEGCRASGTRPEVIEFLWQTNEKSADYSFNKSHAACYALIAYRTAWLKANYTAEYMAALISSVMSTKDKVPFFVAALRGDGHRDPAARRQPVRPRVHGRAVELREPGRQHPLRPGRRQGRRLPGRRGDQAGPSARAASSRSLWDFCERVDSRAVNKKAIEALIKCGAFGSTGASRKGMLAVLEQAQAAGQKAQQDALIGQGSIFDLADAPAAARAARAPARRADGRLAVRRRARAPPSAPRSRPRSSTRPQLLAAEKEAIGLFVSAHPLKPLREALRARVDCPLSALRDRRDKDWVTVGGIIVEAKRIRHAQRRSDDVRDARRSRGRRRAARLRQGARRARGGAGGGRGRARARAGRPQGSRQDVPRRADRRALRPQRAGDRAGQGRGRGAARSAVAVAAPVHLRVDAASLSPSAIEDLKHVIEDYPGPAEVRARHAHASGAEPPAPRRGLPRQNTPTAARRAGARGRAAAHLAVA